jgi:hypothetical protein
MTESQRAANAARALDPPDAWRWLARAAVLLPIAVAVVRALADGWFPVGDSALLAVRAGDVFTRDHPWLGSWTSASLALGVDVNNPGPLYYDLAAPFMWTVGRVAGPGPAVAIAVGTINAAAAIGIVAVGRRIDGWRSERWMLVLVAAITWAMGSELLFDIWQPHALLLPFLLLTVLTVAVANGDVGLLPWWVGVVSVVIQTHVAYVYVSVVLAAIVGVALIRHRRVTRHEQPLTIGRRLWAITGAVAIVCWLQPLYEQFAGRGEGNLQRLATNAGGGELTVGAGTATKIVAAVVALPPWWTRFGFDDSVRSTPLTQTADGPRLYVDGLPNAALAVVAVLLVVGVLGALVVGLSRPQQRAARWAAVVALAGVVVAIGGVSIQAVTVTGLGSHQIRWLFALSVLVHVVIVWGGAEWWRGRQGPSSEASASAAERRLDLGLAAAVAVLVLANLPFHAHPLGPVADRSAEATLRRTFDDLDRFDPDQPVIYDVDNVRVFEPYSSAVMMRLDELGIEFRFVDEGLVRQFGEHRRADGDEAIHIRQYERSEALLFDDPAACVLSRRSGVGTDEEVAADSLIAAAATELTQGPTVVVDGLPDDVRQLVDAALDGNADAAFRIVADDLLWVLVDEQRIEPPPATTEAVAQRAAIRARISTTLLVAATGTATCPS